MYTTESYQMPFWSQSSNFVRGRDPLGVQNSSISVYSRLLPGMTNLTLRLRYYGMYLWLLDEYHNLPEGHEFKMKAQGQYNFIRRAELILAYFMINQYETEQSVIGSDYAIRYKEDLKIIGYYNIATGADRENSDTERGVYWAYKSGALGQYYAGSLISLGLIYTKAERFVRTDIKGVELARAYKTSITEVTANLFIKRIIEGRLFSTDLTDLDNIALNKNYQNSAESNLYTKILLSDDGLLNKKTDGLTPSQRKETLFLFLNLIDQSNNNEEWKIFPRLKYLDFLENNKNNKSEAECGWYYYYLNELAHYALECIFWGMLSEMGDGKFTIEQFISYVSNEAQTYKDINYSDLKDTINDLMHAEIDTLTLVDKINQVVKNKDGIQGIVLGSFVLLFLYHDNKSHIELASNYAAKYQLYNKNGNVLDIFRNSIERNISINYKEYVMRITYSLISDHMNIAYGKMRDGEKNLLKFILEDGFLVHIETMNPSFTSPRIRTVYNFLFDLKLIDENNELTTEGRAILIQA